MKMASWIIVVYMLSALCWWTFLLYSKNEIIFNQQMALFEYQENTNPTSITNVQDTYTSQRRMILAEGFMFGAAMICGVFYLRIGYKKSIRNTRKQNNFLLSVTHELKSPLASIKLAFETIKRRTLKPDQYKLISENGITEVDRLHKQLENMLTATSIDHHYKVQRSVISFQDLIDTIKHRRKYTVGENRVELILGVENPNKTVEVDIRGVIEISNNLIENALKYSEDQVKFIMSQNGNLVRLTVKDIGPGISEAEKKNVFSRFYRIGNEETRNSQGTGLGLFIVKHIVQRNDGKIEIINNRPKGSIFIAELKIA